MFPVWNLRLRSRRLAERLARLGWAAPTLAVIYLMVVRPIAEWMGMALRDVSMPGLLFFLSSPVWLMASSLANVRRRPGGESVRVAGRQLTIEDAGGTWTFGPVVQGAEMAGGVVLEDEKGRELTLGAVSPPALLDALALEPAQRRFTFRWRRGGVRRAMFLLATLANVMFVAFVMGRLGGAADGFLCLGLGASPLVADFVSRWFADASVSVGLDGVATRSVSGGRLFRFADVAHVQVADDELLIITKDQKVHRLLSPPLASEREALEARIREAMDAARAAGGHPELSALLDRAGRTLPEWRAAAAKILTAATGFRDGAAGPGELLGVLGDASAPSEQRLAAAIALGEQAEHRPKIRVAAQTCVSPKLRVALKALAEGEADDTVLERALAEARR